MNPLFYSVKIIDIVYITIIYFIFGYYIAKLVNTICDSIFEFTLIKKELFFQIIFQILLSFFICYIGKKIIDKIPFPLENVGGFIHYKLKEFVQNGGILWSIGILFYQKSLRQKIINFKK